MKTNFFNFRHSPKQSITLLALIILGLSIAPQHALAYWKISGGTVYYDNSKTQWSDVAMFVGRDKEHENYTKVYQKMGKIANTKLCVQDLESWTENYPTYFRFTTCTSYSSGNFGSSDYCGTGNYTNIYTYDGTYEMKVNHWYLFTPANGSNNANLTFEKREDGQDYGRAWNRDQYIHARLSHDGGSTFATPTKSPAFLRVEGYAFDGAKSCNGKSGSEINAGDTYASKKAGIGYTATVKMIVKDVVSGVTFLGFYDGSGNQLKSAADAAQGQTAGQYVYEYMMYSFDDGNVYARFTEPVYEVTLTGFADAKVSAVGPFTTGSATLKVPAGKQFDNYTSTNLTNVNQSDNTFTFNATAAGTLVANYVYKTPVIDHSGSASYEIGGAAIKLNPTYTDVADDATYAWTKQSGPGTVTFSTSASLANPNVSANADGIYTIRVTVTQGDKTTSAYKDITLTVTTAADKCASCFPQTGSTAQ